MWRPLIGATLSQVVLGIARPTMSYAGLNAGATGFEIGVLAAAFAVLPMCIALPFGALAGRWKYIALLPFVSTLILVGACVLAAVADSMTELLISAALLGVGNLGVLLGAQAWISRSAPSTRYAEGFGWMTAGMAFGQAIGPLCAGSVIGRGVLSEENISLAFWVAACASFVLAACFVSTAERSYAAGQNQSHMSTLAILATPGVARYMFMSAAVLTSVDILTAYLPVLGAEAGISPFLIGAMLAVRGAASTLSRLCLGPLSRWLNQSQLMVSSVAGAAFCLIVVGYMPVAWALFIALAVGGFFLGIGQPITMSAIAIALPARTRSSGLALRLLGNRVAQTATPVAAGAFIGSFGVAAVFLVQVFGLALSTAWELAAARKESRDAH